MINFQRYFVNKMDTLNVSGAPLVIPEPQLGRGEQEQTKCSAAANCLAAAATGEHKVECRRGEQQSKDQSVGGRRVGTLSEIEIEKMMPHIKWVSKERSIAVN